jgi:SAM-dependent methyltransferase
MMSPRADLQRTFYNTVYAPGASNTGRLADRLIARFELHRTDAVSRLIEGGGHLLDVGSGDARLLAQCAKRFSRLTGVDLADVRVRGAAADVSSRFPNVRFVQADIDTGLPLQAESVDVVTSVAVIGFIFDPLPLLEELRRVLRPGGQLIVEVLNLAYLPRRMALLTGHFPRHSTAPGWDGGHLHNFTQGALADALDAHGFTVERWSGSGVLAPLRTWWPSLLTGNLIAVCRKR